MPPATKSGKGKRQRFYARNAVNTTLLRVVTSFPGHLMQSSSTSHPAPTDFADEVCATVARLFAYVGVLMLFGILGLHAWDQLRVNFAAEPAEPAGWRIADRSFPAFALSPRDISDKTEKSYAYMILRHASGGRKDIFRWAGGERPAAELEIYRPGNEYSPAPTAQAELATRMLAGGAELEPAGTIESKFGSVALLRPASGGEGAGSCLGYLKRMDDPALQISGWSCQGDGLPARRAAIACMLSRLTLLTSGNEPRLAEDFARAELQRGDCAAASADWLTAAANPGLRGAF